MRVLVNGRKTPCLRRMNNLDERVLWKGSTIIGEDDIEVEIVEGLQRLMRNARRGKRAWIRSRSSVEVAMRDSAVGSCFF